MDPLADKFASVNPYNFGFNDPVYWNDPMGAEPGDDDNPYAWVPYDDGIGYGRNISRRVFASDLNRGGWYGSYAQSVGYGTEATNQRLYSGAVRNRDEIARRQWNKLYAGLSKDFDQTMGKFFGYNYVVTDPATIYPWSNDEMAIRINNLSGANGKDDPTALDPLLFNYVGDQSEYPGALIIETRLMPGGGVTIPPFIFLSPGSGQDKHLKRHEYGHILQYAQLSLQTGSPITGYGLFLLNVGVPSLISAGLSEPGKHNEFWTEKWANQLSYWFNGRPSDWNDRNPVYWK